jgi:hypothetical protein
LRRPSALCLLPVNLRVSSLGDSCSNVKRVAEHRATYLRNNDFSFLIRRSGGQIRLPYGPLVAQYPENRGHKGIHTLFYHAVTFLL